MQLLDLCISDEMISNENLNTLLQISEYLKISRTFSVSKSKINFFFFLEKLILLEMSKSS